MVKFIIFMIFMLKIDLILHISLQLNAYYNEICNIAL